MSFIYCSENKTKNFQTNYNKQWDEQKVIELNNIEQVEKQAIKGKRKIPLIFVGLAAVIFYYYERQKTSKSHYFS